MAKFRTGRAYVLGSGNDWRIGHLSHHGLAVSALKRLRPSKAEATAKMDVGEQLNLSTFSRIHPAIRNPHKARSITLESVLERNPKREYVLTNTCLLPTWGIAEAFLETSHHHILAWPVSIGPFPCKGSDIP